MGVRQEHGKFCPTNCYRSLRLSRQSVMILFLKRLVAGLITTAVGILVSIGLFALIGFYPVYTYHGQGSGGNCGEATMISFSIALLHTRVEFAAGLFVCLLLVTRYWPKASKPRSNEPAMSANGPTGLGPPG